MQHVSPVTVPIVTFPTLPDDTNSWICVAQTAAYVQLVRARIGTISILGSHFWLIGKHGANETG